MATIANGNFVPFLSCFATLESKMPPNNPGAASTNRHGGLHKRGQSLGPFRGTPIHKDKDGNYFILPAHSYGLGVALEKMKVPPNITVICLGKSTYARLGIIVNTTPAEASWEGHLTLEFSNSSGADCRIYANEGICQLLFFEGDPCETTYRDRKGKYQNQPEKVTLAKI